MPFLRFRDGLGGITTNGVMSDAIDERSVVKYTLVVATTSPTTDDFESET